MELAGLSCAQALAKSFPVKTHKRVIVCCGPGNQVSWTLVKALTIACCADPCYRVETGWSLLVICICFATSPPSTCPNPDQRISTSVYSSKSRT